MNAVSATNENLFAATLKSVMVYDDFNFAAHAAAMLEWVAGQADQNLKWDVKPWRLDLLRQLSLTELAEAEAADADLVVLALTEPQSPSDDLLNWLEHWAARREIEDAAVMLLYPVRDAAPAPLAERLQQFAGARGLTFMGGHEVWPDKSSATFIRQQRAFDATEFPPVTEFPRISDHWGLND
jgi:hypothetical protein